MGGEQREDDSRRATYDHGTPPARSGVLGRDGGGAGAVAAIADKRALVGYRRTTAVVVESRTRLSAPVHIRSSCVGHQPREGGTYRREAAHVRISVWIPFFRYVLFSQGEFSFRYLSISTVEMVNTHIVGIDIPGSSAIRVIHPFVCHLWFSRNRREGAEGSEN